MTDSIFRKMLWTCAAVMLASIAAIAVAIGFWMNAKTYERSADMLNGKADQIEALIDRLDRRQITVKELLQQIMGIENNSGVRVSVVGPIKALALRQIQPLGEEPGYRSWVRQVLNGHRVQARSTFAANDTVEMLIVGRPIQLRGNTVGALFLYSPIAEIKGLVRQIDRLIALASAMVAIPAALALYALSKHFAVPIRRVSETAERMAEGDFRQRIPVKGSDEIARLARSFNRMAGKLDRIEQGRKRLIGEISHEMRTPLTTIRGSLTGVLDGVVPQEEVEEILRVSLRESIRLGQLVDDLADLSMFEEQRAELHIARTDVADLVRETVRQLEIKARERDMQLTQDTPESCEADCDRDRIKQVLINLINNAIVHTEPGGKVHVELSRGKRTVTIRVRDSGKGIPPDQLPHLFARFYKADPSRGGQGAGLGLTISKYIAEAHGGGIGVASTPGQGSEFAVHLPLTMT